MLAARITRIQAFMGLTQMLVMPLIISFLRRCPLRGLPAGLTTLAGLTR